MSREHPSRRTLWRPHWRVHTQSCEGCRGHTQSGEGFESDAADHATTGGRAGGKLGDHLDIVGGVETDPAVLAALAPALFVLVLQLLKLVPLLE